MKVSRVASPPRLGLPSKPLGESPADAVGRWSAAPLRPSSSVPLQPSQAGRQLPLIAIFSRAPLSTLTLARRSAAQLLHKGGSLTRTRPQCRDSVTKSTQGGVLLRNRRRHQSNPADNVHSNKLEGNSPKLSRKGPCRSRHRPGTAAGIPAGRARWPGSFDPSTLIPFGLVKIATAIDFTLKARGFDLRGAS